MRWGQPRVVLVVSSQSRTEEPRHPVVAGSQAELHVWPGGFHACDQLAPNARLSKDMTAARDDWMARLLGS